MLEFHIEIARRARLSPALKPQKSYNSPLPVEATRWAILCPGLLFPTHFQEFSLLAMTSRHAGKFRTTGDNP